MIDLFTIFSKGGMVLFYFQDSTQNLTTSVNALIKDVFLQERSSNQFMRDGVTMKFKLDNEFELVFLVAYQSIVQMSYVDKLIDELHRRFRDEYKNVLGGLISYLAQCGSSRNAFSEFGLCFKEIVQKCKSDSLSAGPMMMKTFKESTKSQKNVASMLIKPQENVAKKTEFAEAKSMDGSKRNENSKLDEGGDKENEGVPPGSPGGVTNGLDIDTIEQNKQALLKKRTGVKEKTTPKPTKPVENQKRIKEKRQWVDLRDSKPVKVRNNNDTNGDGGGPREEQERAFLQDQMQYCGKSAQLEDIGYDDNSEVDYSDDEVEDQAPRSKENVKKSATASGGGWFSAFKSLVGSKKISAEDLEPGLDKMREHLTAKNVAADIADKICTSVGQRLEGKMIGTFSGVAATVKDSVRESLVQLLSPQRRVDILRDVMEAKRQNRSYSIVFCGVNGVGKSTNLAKIAFWLVENNCRILIAACDTFRAGAVEQLKTHTKHLNALHPESVHLYEQGYGKDAANIAASAIMWASDFKYDVVLVDTAGRMQDNEPLMRALAKLIRMNEPDLVLFVGEALVGNEAVDQLTKFNQALEDNSNVDKKGRTVDGIVLTKFDTIDDKVGAAISMTYVTGQPIVFVGTGQTYKDLKNLNANAVVQALLK